MGNSSESEGFFFTNREAASVSNINNGIVHVLTHADGRIIHGEETLRKLLCPAETAPISNVFELLDVYTVAELSNNLKQMASGRTNFWMKQLLLEVSESQKIDVIVHISQGTILGCYDMLIYPLTKTDDYEKLRKQAYTDELTGLPNFRKFREDVAEKIESSAREKLKFGIIFLDVDHFKQINDEKGHLIGDRTLCECAKRLQQSITENNIVYRKSGDEFLIIINNANDMERIQLRIEDEFSRLFKIENDQYLVQISTGVGIYPDQGRTMDELMDISDRALYQVKRIKKILRYGF